MCRVSNAVIYREWRRESSRSLVSSWTFAARRAARLWPLGEPRATAASAFPEYQVARADREHRAHRARRVAEAGQHELLATLGRCGLPGLRPRDDTVDAAVPDGRVVLRGFGGDLRPSAVGREPASCHLRLFGLGRRVGDDPLELADGFVL